MTPQRGLMIVGAFLAAVSVRPSAQAEFPFRDATSSTEDRVDSILSLMTVEEKLACLGVSTAVPRLGIPNAGNSEGLHGLVRKATADSPGIPTTSFGQVVGMGATWDKELMRRAGAVQGYEARYVTQHDHVPVLVVWGPNADLSRDPRWGRNEESFGEDSFLTGTLSAAFVRGLQGDDSRYWQVASLMKHFLANSNETTRGSSSSDFDARLFREYYSLPFRLGFQAGARSVMAAYNAMNRVPMTVHDALRDVVAGEWGADGIISSDARAIPLMVSEHRYFKTENDAIGAALRVGINQILWPRTDVVGAVRHAFEAGAFGESDLDRVLRGKFRTVIRLGLLDPPGQVPYAKIGAPGEPAPWSTERHKAVAREVAHESIVLLKNSAATLPLNQASIRSVAVIGRFADQTLIDLYGGPLPYAVPILDAIRDKVGSAMRVQFARNNEGNHAVDAARSSDVAIVVVGNHPFCGDALEMRPVVNADNSTKPCPDPGEGREGRDRTTLELTDEALVRTVFAANRRTIVIVVSSFPYAINWTQQYVPAILWTTHAAQEQGAAVADVLFGAYNPSGRLTQTWPKSSAQLPPIEDYDLRKGRTYMYSTAEPLYPFGYGLSYTTFAYSNLRFSASALAENSTITVSVDVTNTGTRQGGEVVQLYVSHIGSAVPRPRKALKGFDRVVLEPRETRTVQIPLRAEDLAYWDQERSGWRLERGSVTVMAGGSSAGAVVQRTLAVR
ncbi:MAG: glycoside hydrolase family 3 C-terminal domain-containing protein [Vicinamibacterales bacterium]